MEEAQPISILAVDDEPGVLALVRRYLRDACVTVIEASSGKEALQRLATALDPTFRCRGWQATSLPDRSARWSPT